jgi:hypothetical protein
MAKNTICLWYDKDAEAAARFYAATFPDSAVGAIHHAPSDYHPAKRVMSWSSNSRLPASLVSASMAVRHSNITRPSRSRSRPKIRTRPIDTGTPSSGTAGRKALAAGAKTNGASPGKSHRVS